MQHIYFINTLDKYTYEKHFKKALSNIPKELQNMSIFSYSASSANLPSLIDEVSSPLLGSPYKIITLTDYDKLATKKEFVTLLQQTPENCFLFLIKEKPPTPKKLLDFIKKNRSRILEINLYEITSDIIVKRIVEFFKENDIKYDMDAVQKYSSIFEYQQDLLLNELDKVALYLSNSDRRFDHDLLKELVFLSPQYNVFQIIRLFFSKQTKQTLLSLHDFLSKSPNSFILLQTLLTKESKRIILFKELKNMNKGDNEIFKELGLTFYKAQQSLQSLVKNFSLKEIKIIDDNLHQMEYLLKSSSLQSPDVNKSNINIKAYQLLLKIVTFMEHGQ